MVLLDPKTKNAQATFTFKAEISTYDSSTVTIKNSHQPVVHSSHGYQCCVIMLDDDGEPLQKLQFQ